MKNVNTVIFDIGRVLVEFDWKSYIREFGYNEDINEALGDAIFKSDIWRERDRGGKTEEEYREEFISNSPHLKKEIEELYKNIADVVEVYPFAREWIQSIKAQGKKVYLLSNYSQANFENDLSKFDFIQDVDGAIISYEVNCIKPEPEIYQKLISKYKINPEEAVFLDDLEENLEGARAFGIGTIHVTSHEKAVAELAKLGIH